MNTPINFSKLGTHRAYLKLQHSAICLMSWIILLQKTFLKFLERNEVLEVDEILFFKSIIFCFGSNLSAVSIIFCSFSFSWYSKVVREHNFISCFSFFLFLCTFYTIVCDYCMFEHWNQQWKTRITNLVLKLIAALLKNLL